MFDNLLDPILGPLLNSMHPLALTILVAFAVSIITIIAYKLLTDQDLMKRLKSEMKEMQKEMKTLKDHPEKMMQVQKKAMETNMKYMAKSMKPTLITFIPLIIIFGWMHANLGYLPIVPDQDFMTTIEFEGYDGLVTLSAPDALNILSNSSQKVINNEVTWALSGPAGEYVLEYNFQGEIHTRNLIISEQLEYVEPELKIKNSRLKSLNINNEKLKVLDLGFMKLGWLGVYIICSLIFSMSLRKWLKIA